MTLSSHPVKSTRPDFEKASPAMPVSMTSLENSFTMPKERRSNRRPTPSSAPVANAMPLPMKAVALMSPSFPAKVIVQAPDRASHSLAVQSQDPDTNSEGLVGCTSRVITSPAWSSNTVVGRPAPTSQSTQVESPDEVNMVLESANLQHDRYPSWCLSSTSTEPGAAARYTVHLLSRPPAATSSEADCSNAQVITHEDCRAMACVLLPCSPSQKMRFPSWLAVTSVDESLAHARAYTLPKCPLSSFLACNRGMPVSVAECALAATATRPGPSFARASSHSVLRASTAARAAASRSGNDAAPDAAAIAARSSAARAACCWPA
mmetsp:Transcript_26510/g.99745  ORF Transcript_26510/g.99745 Transcript_26510/m.99745 type:complete len:321 (+) Transcript_26510:577-1539(+)